jgi:hypothetical protein
MRIGAFSEPATRESSLLRHFRTWGLVLVQGYPRAHGERATPPSCAESETRRPARDRTSGATDLFPDERDVGCGFHPVVYEVGQDSPPFQRRLRLL